MNVRLSKWVVAGSLAALVTAPAARAQYRGMHEVDEPVFKTDHELVVERKKPRFYRRPSCDTAEAQLAYARERLETSGNGRKTRAAFRNLVHEWHNAPEAVLAQQQFAALLEEARKYKAAFMEYQYLVEFFPGQFPYEQVLEHQFQLAQVVQHERVGRLILLGGVKAPERAIPLFEKVAANGPNSRWAPQARFKVGQIHEELKEYAEAVRAYEIVANGYPGTDLALEAAYRRAECLFTSATRRPRDEKSLRAAVVALSRFVTDNPSHDAIDVAKAHLDEARTHLAAVYYERAVFYDEKARQPRAALLAYDTFVKECPWSDRIPVAAGRMKTLQQQINEEDGADAQL